MDASTFDRLTRTLGGAATRRDAMRLLAGGALGGALGRLGLAGAIAGVDCGAVGAGCGADAPCCAGLGCSAEERGDPPARRCCLPEPAKCKKPGDCCSDVCKKQRGKRTGRCACLANGKACAAATRHRCCSRRCEGGRCVEPCPGRTADCGDGVCRQCCGAGDCGDGIACTDDSCDPDGNCQHTPNHGRCADLDEACKRGRCAPGDPSRDARGCVAEDRDDGAVCGQPAGATATCDRGRCVVTCHDGTFCDQRADACAGGTSCSCGSGPECGSDRTCFGGRCVCPPGTQECSPIDCKPLCRSDPDGYRDRFQSCMASDPRGCSFCTTWMGCNGTLDTGTECGTVTAGCD